MKLPIPLLAVFVSLPGVLAIQLRLRTLPMLLSWSKVRRSLLPAAQSVTITMPTRNFLMAQACSGDLRNLRILRRGLEPG